jgi:RecB family endonuclease NucS
MRVVIANCEVTYKGRGHTELPMGVRAIVIKEDGAISVHAEYNGNKPLNYMPAGTSLSVDTLDEYMIWTFQSKKESIEIIISEVLSDIEFKLADTEPGLSRHNTEKDLQKFIAENPSSVLYHYGISNATPESLEIHREYNTKAGAVDILIVDRKSKTIYIIEVKRIAMLGAVDQCRRYRSAYINNPVENTENFKIITAIAAWDIRPNTTALANRHDIDCILVKLEDS